MDSQHRSLVDGGQGCGRFFEGTPSEMHTALNKTLAALSDDTKVYVRSRILPWSFFIDERSRAMSIPSRTSSFSPKYCKPNRSRNWRRLQRTIKKPKANLRSGMKR